MSDDSVWVTETWLQPISVHNGSGRAPDQLDTVIHRACPINHSVGATPQRRQLLRFPRLHSWNIQPYTITHFELHRSAFLIICSLLLSVLGGKPLSCECESILYVSMQLLNVLGITHRLFPFHPAEHYIHRQLRSPSKHEVEWGEASTFMDCSAVCEKDFGQAGIPVPLVFCDTFRQHCF